jgi:hypothetical protein
MSLFIRKPSNKQVQALQYLLPTHAERPVELHPDELERLAVYVYQRLGYRKVKHTGIHSSTDGGVDVWLLNKRGEIEVVQCKQWQSKISKTDLIEFAKVVRQQHAEVGHYWAPGGFSQPAVEYAEKNNIEIYADYGIRKLLEASIEAERNSLPLPVRQRKKAGWKTWQIVILFGMGLIACSLLCSLLGVLSGGQ